MSKAIVLYNWLDYCPACGESSDLYWSVGQDPVEPSPAEAHCERCGWFYVESSQHNPTLLGVIKHRRQAIKELRQTLKQIERWNPSPSEKRNKT